MNSKKFGWLRNDFIHYISGGKIYEGLVKFLALAPLMRLAGFYRYPIKIMLEENIADINIEDEDPKITGARRRVSQCSRKTRVANGYSGSQQGYTNN